MHAWLLNSKDSVQFCLSLGAVVKESRHLSRTEEVVLTQAFQKWDSLSLDLILSNLKELLMQTLCRGLRKIQGKTCFDGLLTIIANVSYLIQVNVIHWSCELKLATSPLGLLEEVSGKSLDYSSCVSRIIERELASFHLRVVFSKESVLLPWVSLPVPKDQTILALDYLFGVMCNFCLAVTVVCVFIFIEVGIELVDLVCLRSFSFLILFSWSVGVSDSKSHSANLTEGRAHVFA